MTLFQILALTETGRWALPRFVKGTSQREFMGQNTKKLSWSTFGLFGTSLVGLIADNDRALRGTHVRQKPLARTSN